jgi:hypothetical protein
LAHIFDHGLYGRYDGLNPAETLDLVTGDVSEPIQQRS